MYIISKDWSFKKAIFGQITTQNVLLIPVAINIDRFVQECKTLCSFDLVYKSSECYIKNTNNLIEINVSPGSYFIYYYTL